MISTLSKRAASFCFWFVESGGNGTAAARRAGYQPRSACKMAVYLLKNDHVLQLIAAQIRRKAPGHDRALSRLMMPSRPAELRRRMAELVCRGEGKTAPPVTYALPSEVEFVFAPRETPEIPANPTQDPLI